MKTTIKFFAALFILLIASNLQAQSIDNDCTEIEMQTIYQGNSDMACYDVYVYTSEVVLSITIDGQETCTNTDVCMTTLCFDRQDEAYEVYINSQIEQNSSMCRAAEVGAIVTIAP